MSHYFLDPLLRGPMLGSMLICLVSSVVGVFVYLSKRSLIGETLSHATYPGVILGAFVVALLGNENLAPFFVLSFAFIAAILGVYVLNFLQKRNISQDTALCFVLSGFFGIGLLFASSMQREFGMWYRKIQEYIFGQASLLTDTSIWTTSGICVLTLLLVMLFYKEIKLVLFDRTFAFALGVRVKWIDALLLGLITLCVVAGIQTVGIVLMSGMLIIPALTARQFTNQFLPLILLSAFFGMLSAFFGNVLSFDGSLYFLKEGSFPTGPSIILVSALLCLCALIFSPKKGLLFRAIRAMQFKNQCLLENILKAVWKYSDHSATFNSVKKSFHLSRFFLKVLVWQLYYQGYLLSYKELCLTPDGQKKAAHLVRLHRLWEVYLAKELDVQISRVHINAEEIEHILSQELEKDLEEMVQGVKKDPHEQWIPTKEMTQ
ncbi:MAG: Manganese transport system membrane protein MntB [Chlamydiae bacterium]|nr:Manganese transport system membrane protein MntB [Chlamydiota bacterium]